MRHMPPPTIKFGKIEVRPGERAVARVAREGASWVLRFTRSPGLVGDIAPWGDAWVARWRDRSLNADALVRLVSVSGGGTRIEMKALHEDTDFSFDFHHLNLVRVAD
jgi:hypothetical protein